jgi:hypothetical protein
MPTVTVTVVETIKLYQTVSVSAWLDIPKTAVEFACCLALLDSSSSKEDAPSALLTPSTTHKSTDADAPPDITRTTTVYVNNWFSDPSTAPMDNILIPPTDVSHVLDLAAPALQPHNALPAPPEDTHPTHKEHANPHAETDSLSAHKLVIPATTTQLDASAAKFKLDIPALDNLQSASPIPQLPQSHQLHQLHQSHQ